MNKTILLVEDNPNDEKLTLMAFEKNSFHCDVVVARDGAEALDYLYGTGKYQGRDLSHIPAVILLDLKLPKLDGLEVLKQMRSHWRTKLIPVVMLTSSREEEDLVQGYTHGANSYIHKPIDFNKFMETARQLGLYWLFVNESPPASREE